jgi:hypothetical protein
VAAGEVWTRIGAGHESSALAPAMSPAAIELDDVGHPWLWLCDGGELSRVDGLALTQGPVERWAIEVEFQIQRMLVTSPSPAPEPSTILHADELAELLALEPELGEAWREWFDGHDPRAV